MISDDDLRHLSTHFQAERCPSVNWLAKNSSVRLEKFIRAIHLATNSTVQNLNYNVFVKMRFCSSASNKFID